MKTDKFISILFAIAVFFGLTITAEADLYVISDTEFGILTGGASYGPPPAVGFPDGPTSVGSGEPIELYYGPSPGQTGADALLFVLSTYEESFGGTIGFSLSGSSVNFNTGNFFDSDLGFPDNIEGIGNGEVGGVKFPDARHAGVVYYDFAGGGSGEIFGSLSITSPIFPLRVDIFSLDGFNYSPNPGFEGTIIGNTPNSHSLAVVPEPATMLLLGSGLIGFAAARRKKFFKK